MTPLWLCRPWDGKGFHTNPGTWKNTSRGSRGANSQCCMVLLPSFVKGDEVRLFPEKCCGSGLVLTKFGLWTFYTSKRQMAGDFQDVFSPPPQLLIRNVSLFSLVRNALWTQSWQCEGAPQTPLLPVLC